MLRLCWYPGCKKGSIQLGSTGVPCQPLLLLACLTPTTPPSGHSACVAGNKMYVVGGSNAADYFGDVAEYCFETGTWCKILVDTEVPRFRHSLHTLEHTSVGTAAEQRDGVANSVLLVCGGLAGDCKEDAARSLMLMDLRALTPQPGSTTKKRGTWVPLRCAGAALDPAITGQATVVHSGSLYTFGGYANNAVLSPDCNHSAVALSAILHRAGETALVRGVPQT